MFAQNYQNKTKGSSGLALGLTSMAARPEDTAKLPPRPPWGPPTRARDCRWLASVGISEAALRAIGAGGGRCLGGHQMRQIAAKWPRQPSGGAARKARGGHAPGIVVNYRETERNTYVTCTPLNVGATSQRTAYSHVCLLMSLLRETPILDDDLNPRFIARLSLYSDPSCID